MPVSSVIEIQSGVSGSAKGSDARKPRVSYNSSYQVTCTSASDTATTVLAYFRGNALLPWIGRYYQFGNDFDPYATCRSVNPRLIEKSAGRFNVDCSFEPIEDEEEKKQDKDGKETSNPLEWRDEIDVSYSQITVPVEYATFHGFTNAARGNRDMKVGSYRAVTNSALQPFDPTFEAELDIKIIRITKYTAKHDGGQDDKYISTVNDKHVTIKKKDYNFTEDIGPFNGRIKNINSTFAINNGIKYYRKTIEVHKSPIGWRFPIVDRGSAELWRPGDLRPGKNGQPVTDLSAADFPASHPFETRTITDQEDYPLQSPQLLDGNGHVLDAGKPAVILTWAYYIETDWSAIKW